MAGWAAPLYVAAQTASNSPIKSGWLSMIINRNIIARRNACFSVKHRETRWFQISSDARRFGDGPIK
jgi:hypothetical protein